MKKTALIERLVKIRLKVHPRISDFIRNRPIINKVFLVPSVPLACIVLLGIIFCGFLINQRLIVDEIFEKRFYIFKLSSEIVIRINQVNTGLHKGLLWAQSGYNKKNVEKLLDRNLAELDEVNVLIRRILTEDALEIQERKTFESVLKKQEEFRARALFAKESTLDVNDVTSAAMMLQMGDDQFSLLYDDLNNLMMIQDRISGESREASHDRIWLFITLVILFVFIALALSMLAAIVIASYIANPVNSIINVLRENPGWDLDTEKLAGITSSDELGEFARYFIEYSTEIKNTTQKLVEARDELWGEMKLARKIQTILLPVNPVVPGYEITVQMTPADQVGGDYYDVIDVSGVRWIVIGDVSGHGVPAGLVMMMLQTSIRTVLFNNPHTGPSKVLSDINRVLTSNIQALGEDKYITINIFACFDGGRFVYSGLHEDIMIYRSATRSVELVKTKGMWLGLVDEIKPFMEDDELILGINDVLLLYTDGITEAFDSANVIYSKTRLAGILEQNGHRTADEIRSVILESLEEYRKHDDITMVVVKRTEQDQLMSALCNASESS